MLHFSAENRGSQRAGDLPGWGAGCEERGWGGISFVAPLLLAHSEPRTSRLRPPTHQKAPTPAHSEVIQRLLSTARGQCAHHHHHPGRAAAATRCLGRKRQYASPVRAQSVGSITSVGLVALTTRAKRERHVHLRQWNPLVISIAGKA
eukprot:gene7580-biopygen13593